MDLACRASTISSGLPLGVNHSTGPRPRAARIRRLEGLRVGEEPPDPGEHRAHLVVHGPVEEHPDPDAGGESGLGVDEVGVHLQRGLEVSAGGEHVGLEVGRGRRLVEAVEIARPPEREPLPVEDQ